MLFSVIIPVFGQWQLTKNCLLSLKREIDVPFEVILVDNGANVLEFDETREEAPLLGKELFQDNFVYLPQEKNLNFAGASNLGAKTAKTPLLFFLNNDTVVMRNFLAPLLAEFSQTSAKIMAGPLLLYPPKKIKNYKEHTLDDFSQYTIQHLGVSLNPKFEVSHIHENLPANHRVAKRRKEFQFITAAAFFIRKDDFFELNGFDEEFINGFEDLDFCVRFKHAGGKLVVTPESKVVHLTSQSQGRNDFTSENAKLFSKKTQAFNVQPDKHILFERDGYELHINKWLELYTKLHPSLEEKYKLLLEENNYNSIKIAYYEEPYWQEGFYALLRHAEITEQDFLELYSFKIKTSCSDTERFNCIKYMKNHFNISVDNAFYSQLLETILQQFLSLDKCRLPVLNSLLKQKRLSKYFIDEVREYINDHENFMQTEYLELIDEVKKFIG